MKAALENDAYSAISGKVPVKTDCLPFTQIPHSTRLFTEFLAYTATARRFYPRSPRFSDWLKDETPNQRYDQNRRDRMANILERQNKNWKVSSKTLSNIERFRAGASAVVTGQQVGLFGGPLFALFKALTALKLADEASAHDVDAVPIFWLASEDHDLAEVSHSSMPDPEGHVEALVSSARGIEDAPVGTIQFGPDINALAEAAATLLGASEVSGWLRESYREAENFGSAFARLFAKLFADWGVILLDGSDPELDHIAEPIYRAAVEQAAAIDEALLNRGRELESAGYHQQVKVTPSSTLLFTFRAGARTVIHRKGNGDSSMDFIVGDEKITQHELLRRISDNPQNFSPNVLLRPVVQDYLLPTLAYTGGAAEVAYFTQAGVVYETLLGHVTPVVPRFSATLVDAKSRRLLDKYDLALTDLFLGPEALKQELASRTLPPDLQAAFDKAFAALDQCVEAIRGSLARLDTTLVDAANRAGSKMQYQLEHLRSSAARAELRQSEVLERHAAFLSNLLFPHKTLQEREIAGIYFVARFGPELLKLLYDNIHSDCLDHQIVSLSA
ncbi:MAG TPA: bacillithiol biosynthesis cysteine-adding enzyme BshC [Terriglobales bacterium]|nr:bacillithiol biosynthesis cysteine-adding enzyme BshC [Terriglobales bacterium]